MEFIITLAYTSFFIFLIQRWRFFAIPELSRGILSVLFLLKVLAGIGLWVVYTRIYTDRSTADIFKYFDDGRILFNAVWQHPGDFLSMLTGLHDSPDLDHYYAEMKNWNRVVYSNILDDNHTMIRYNALLHCFSLGYYNVHSVVTNFLSFCGLVAIYKAYRQYFIHKEKILAAAIFLLPSVIFWGSGVLKESLILFALGFLSLTMEKLFNKQFSIKIILTLLAASFLLLLTKYHILLALLPGIIYRIFLHRTGNTKPVLKFLFTFCILLLCFLGIDQFAFGKKILTGIVFKQQDFINQVNGGIGLFSSTDTSYVNLKAEDAFFLSAKGDTILNQYTLKPGANYLKWKSGKWDDTIKVYNSTDTSTIYRIIWNIKPAGSKVDIPRLQARSIQFIKKAPMAFYTVLFRPYIWDSKSPLILLSAIENLVLLFFIVYCLLSIVKNKNSVNYELFFYCISFVVVIYTLTGWVTPVFGAIVRYKVPAMPMLVMAFLLLYTAKTKVAKFNE